MICDAFWSGVNRLFLLQSKRYQGPGFILYSLHTWSHTGGACAFAACYDDDGPCSPRASEWTVNGTAQNCRMDTRMSQRRGCTLYMHIATNLTRSFTINDRLNQYCADSRVSGCIGNAACRSNIPLSTLNFSREGSHLVFSVILCRDLVISYV